jgi:RNase P subunit RPR2
MNGPIRTAPAAVIGSRAVIRFAPHDWRVVCAACHGPLMPAGVRGYVSMLQANLKATEARDEGCRWCGLEASNLPFG